jgi:hypothetical protein
MRDMARARRERAARGVALRRMVMQLWCGNRRGTVAAVALGLCAAIGMTGSASAAPSFFDDFENGVNGNHTYAPWGNNTGDPTSPNGINNLLTTDTSKNHTPAGSKSARAFASDPAAWNGFADFGSTTGPIHAEVWTFEDHSDPGTSNPVINMLCLIGEASGNPSFTDFLYLGVIGQGGSSQFYGTRSATGGFTTSTIAREAGWTKFTIDADAVGGQVRFYVDTPSLPDTLIGTSARNANSLRFVRLGANNKSYENVWYDDLSVVPEPGSVAVLAFGAAGLGLARRRRRPGA